jgi:hypothetical protein
MSSLFARDRVVEQKRVKAAGMRVVEICQPIHVPMITSRLAGFVYKSVRRARSSVVMHREIVHGLFTVDVRKSDKPCKRTPRAAKIIFANTRKCKDLPRSEKRCKDLQINDLYFESVVSAISPHRRVTPTMDGRSSWLKEKPSRP